jgi:hypothetical protein
MMTDAEIAQLQADNQLLRTAGASAKVAAINANDHTSLYVFAVLTLSLVAIGAIVGIFITRPDKDNMGLILTVLGFLVPLVTGFLGAALREVHLAVNGRLTQLLALTEKASRAEGQLHEQSRSAAAKTNGG